MSLQGLDDGRLQSLHNIVHSGNTSRRLEQRSLENGHRRAEADSEVSSHD